MKLPATFRIMVLPGVILATVLAGCGEAATPSPAASTSAAASVAVPSPSSVAPAAASVAPAASSAAAAPTASSAAASSSGAAAASASPKPAGASPAASGSAGASGAPTTTVQVETIQNVGKILADPRGMTLYTYSKDQKGVSNCTDACALTWPPLIAFGQSFGPPGVTGVLDAITRSDGKKQVTWNQLPLYTYSGDMKPGDTRGNGVGGNWQVVPAA